MTPPSDSSATPSVRGAGHGAAPAPDDFLARRSVKQQLLQELRAGWENGDRVQAEELLPRWPGSPSADPDVASLLLEEYCQRRRQGEQPASGEYERRFPSQKQLLDSLSNQHALLRSLGWDKPSSGMLLSLPEAGEEVLGFHLCKELGRGSFARVFLAQQTALAGRPVVVKISAIDGDEPQTLAQLQHTNIVPIYSAHEDAAAGMRVVCMPYFGGASLSRVLEVLWAQDHLPVQGKELAEALAAVGNPAVPAAESAADNGAVNAKTEDAGFLANLSKTGYVRAAAWLTSLLADALQHAHERGVLHRDIKPSNVLLGADGQPMLLDFNLSQNLAGRQAQAVATLGGTVAYMAPEHLRALAARDPALVRQVDHRADLYGLGMVLYEMLTGRRPFDQSASYSPMPALIEAMAVERGHSAPSVRERRADVSWTLESIVRKCLAPDPAQRYQQANHLADDLRRYLEDRPLRYAPELSRAERTAKFVRRHPRLVRAGTIATAAVLLLALGGSAFAVLQSQLRAARERAFEAESAEARELMRQIVEGVERARCLVNTTTGTADQVKEGLTGCEQMLAFYELLTRFDEQQHSGWQRLEPDQQRSLAEDVRELFLLMASGRVYLATQPDPKRQLSDEARRTVRDALTLVDRAEAIEGLPPSSALWQDRASYLDKLGEASAAAEARKRARSLAPASVRDHYLLATAYARERRSADAIAELKQALRLNPRHYWSLFLLGTCLAEQGKQQMAYGAYSACVHLWPEFAWGYWNRGRVAQHLGWNAEALEDYTASLARDPGLLEAYVNRGLLYLDVQQPAQALADFDLALARGRHQAVVHTGRGIALEALGRHAEADVAFATGLAAEPANVNLLLGYGFAVAERLPEKANDAFTTVLKQERGNTRALYGCAMLQQRKARTSELALFFFNLALQADPTFVAARRGRANVLAHRGECEQARQDIDWCVKADPTRVTLYAAACVYALIAEKVAEPGSGVWADRALHLLREALALGYGRDKAAADGDLARLRRLPEFRSMLREDKTAPVDRRGE
jgi:eukaryotic-like serine/threonine-protein kinase